MKTQYWHLDGDYAIHIATGYECWLPANLGPGYTWADHISGKPWGHPAVVRELQQILKSRKPQPVAAQSCPAFSRP